MLCLNTRTHFQCCRHSRLAPQESLSWAPPHSAPTRIRLFPTASLGTPLIQCLFLLLIFTGAALMFACRITSLVVFSISKRSFVILSTMEVTGSLSLLSGLCVVFGVVGAALSVDVSCGCVLVSSLMVVRRSFSVGTPR